MGSSSGLCQEPFLGPVPLLVYPRDHARHMGSIQKSFPFDPWLFNY